MKKHYPVVFEEFFELGLPETASPFLKPASRKWGKNLTLKAALIATFLLILSFALIWHPQGTPLARFLLILVFFFAGIPSLIESIEDLASFQINIDILMTLAAFGSILIGSPMEGALLLVLFALSGAMEEAVTTKAKSAIRHLHQLAPTKACVLDESGQTIEKALDQVPIQTKILVKAGEIVPLDGVVVKGTSSVNLVHLTGENVPLRKEPGDEVPAAARNLEGALVVRVTRTSADSTLAKIIKLVTQAQEARPQLQRWFDKVSDRYAKGIILLASLFALFLPVAFGISFLGEEGSLYRALAFLIAASPCALIIAIPIAYLSAVSVCARNGILLKGGIALDAIVQCGAMAFDKTGTLTTGDLRCLGLERLGTSQHGDEKIIGWAYALENNAVHPIAKALVAFAREKGIRPALIENFRAVPGYGLEGEDDGLQLAIGHPDFVIPKLPEEVGREVTKRVEKMRAEGETLTILTIDREVVFFQFEDTLRPSAKKTLQGLERDFHLRVLMLTGDHEAIARTMAGKLGLVEYHADLRPEDKLQFVSRMAQDVGLAMVGDGINDAPALARATIGIAMGEAGSTAALDAAEIVLLNDKLEKIHWLVKKAYQTKKIVKQNLVIATVAIIVASVPALAGIVPLWLAVILHEGGTVLVGLNALRLLRG